MLHKNEFPILEFDENKFAKIEPSYIFQKMEVPEVCVITFFSDAFEEMAKEKNFQLIKYFKTTTMRVPIYKTTYDNREIGITKGFLGAAAASSQLEELIAIGFRKFIVCGAAGVLQKGIQVGKLIIPEIAVRDEGTSYHYIAPSREISMNAHAINILESKLNSENIPYLKAKTWTTDAFYRETKSKVDQRVSEGCVTVEMEASALFAVAQFRDVVLGQILYGGDDLSGVKWDFRNAFERADIRKNLIELSLKVALEL